MLNTAKKAPSGSTGPRVPLRVLALGLLGVLTAVAVAMGRSADVDRANTAAESYEQKAPTRSVVMPALLSYLREIREAVEQANFIGAMHYTTGVSPDAFAEYDNRLHEDLTDRARAEVLTTRAWVLAMSTNDITVSGLALPTIPTALKRDVLTIALDDLRAAQVLAPEFADIYCTRAAIHVWYTKQVDLAGEEFGYCKKLGAPAYWTDLELEEWVARAQYDVHP